MVPPWGSKLTCNINVQMNYWPVEMTNLSEIHQTLFDAMDELKESGEKTAKAHYGARGWVLHHNFDIWRATAPVNASNHGIWVTGAAWLCTHVWEHYLFTGDKEFLAKRGYPLMKSASVKGLRARWISSGHGMEERKDHSLPGCLRIPIFCEGENRRLGQIHYFRAAIT